MIQAMTNSFSTGVSILFGITFIIGLSRLIKGPTIADRVVASNAASTVIVRIVGMVSVIYGTDAYSDSIMLIAVISFVGSVSISRFIGGGRVLNGAHKKRH